MIRVCYYKGCGVVYGEKEPLSDKQKTHGLCPKHLEISLKELGRVIEEIGPGSVRVLMVEDNALFRELFKIKFQIRFPRIEAYEAVDGKEAIRKVETLHPRLIFMDVDLPGENGLELARQVKTRYPSTIIVILTGYDLPKYRELSSQCADHFCLKDLSSTEDIFTLVEPFLSGCV